MPPASASFSCLTNALAMHDDQQEPPATADSQEQAPPASTSTSELPAAADSQEQEAPAAAGVQEQEQPAAAQEAPAAADFLSMAGNDTCFDCEVSCAEDRWCSVTYATALCIRCAGEHRALGVHRSFVRSLALDTLKPEEVHLLLLGGNARLQLYLAEEMGVSRNAWLALPLELRYHTPAADLYRRRLVAEAGGNELPTELEKMALPPPPPPPKTRTWTPDEEAPVCQLCRVGFDLFTRRHHCRKCGRCVCAGCSPPSCMAPLPELGPGSPSKVRHCKLCNPPPAQLMIGM